ncbi:MAG: type VI secretion system membrane subunit TssM [Polyangiaceae bacterium]
MWIWMCVLAGLLILIVWALKFVLAWGTAMPVMITLLILALLGGYFALRWWLARRAATKLERAIHAQAAQQAMSARPERRAEIQELQKQLQAGMSALKTSKLARGGKRGGSALYSMPWYMIIGPPGAGKTTALKHSGMVFPYGGQNGGAVRGVGGTRNCDWWFTNEAILLDTAGRYTTESDDRDEWISFLQFLRKYRPNRPINGVIVAISISELLDANEQQIEATGKKLRARMDEVMTQLQMVVPVYLLFTKIDLIAGFVEFFGDMKKSDRSQPWGSTLKLDLPKNEPGKLFDAEFDRLVQALHARVLKRLSMERSREAREKLYQFPLEFAGLKKNLSELIGITFQPNAFQGTPVFRGFYFTSGTQEGKPMDRVLARMNAAMGIRSPATDQAQQQGAAVESKSYFLHDVFMTIIFPDGGIAARSAAEVRRRLLLQLAIAGAMIALASILLFPAISSYYTNKSFLLESQKATRQTAKLDWKDSTAPSDKIPLLKPTLDRLKEHDKFESDGVPIGMRWWMYTADKVEQPTRDLYAKEMQIGFLEPCKKRLEEKLDAVTGEKYLADRTLLKLYLMLADREHLDVDWAAGRYVSLWVEIMGPQNTLSPGQLKDLARPHVVYYFDLLKRGKIQPISLDDERIKKVRATLQAVPVDRRYYDLIVNSLIDERIDESGDPVLDNLVFPPIQLPRVFPDRNDVLKYFISKSYDANKVYTQVEGPYTDKGHAAVVKQIELAEGLLRTEAWVVPLTDEESGDKIPKYVASVKTRYEETYVAQWMAFFDDIKIKAPTTPDDAEALWKILSTPEYPMRRLLQVLEDNTQFKNNNPLEANDAIAREANRRFNQKLSLYTQGFIVTVDLKELAKRTDKIPTKFDKSVKFAKGSKADGSGDSRTFLYGELIKGVLNKLFEARSKDPTNFNLLDLKIEIAAARKSAEGLLEGYDDTTRKLLLNMLLQPLDVVGSGGVTGVDPDKLPKDKPPKDKVPPNNPWKLPKPR